MGDLKHDLNVLVLVAKNDATIKECRGELARIPDQVARARRELVKVEEAEKKSIDQFEAGKKERRELEATLQDNEAKIKKIKNQLMDAQSNKEYQAFLKEIELLEGNIDVEEERLLELMEALDDHRADHEAELENLATQKAEKQKSIDEMKQRAEYLEREIAKLEGENPKYLNEIDPALRKKYERVQASLGSLAVTRVTDGNCGGCGAMVPPQRVVEVRSNDQLITCQNCGRILVSYVD
jgi:predicted  nucleic acid-binding Zn-ribbon protein